MIDCGTVENPIMKSKNFISLCISMAFVALSVTGLLLYFAQKSQPVEMIHSLLGIVFVAFAIFHIINNWSSWTSYVSEKGTKKVKKEFVISLIIMLILVAGTAADLPPFEEMARAGKSLFGGNKMRAPRTVFEVVSTNQEDSGRAFRIYFEKDQDVLLPVVAIWCEDTTGTLLENLFVPSTYEVPEEEGEDLDEVIEEGELESKTLDLTMLPTFNSHSSDKKTNYALSTPVDNFILRSKLSHRGSMKIFIEVRFADKNLLYSTTVTSSQASAKFESATADDSIRAVLVFD
jgi:hypothetical protein